jgi:hypothetical protein
VLNCFEKVHKAGFVYNDLKLDNIMVGFCQKLPEKYVEDDGESPVIGGYKQILTALGPEVNAIVKNITEKYGESNIFLINDDCCKFNIKNNLFNAVWSVQTLQHIPNYVHVYKKIYNQLKAGGYFYNCNLNINYMINFIYWTLNKKYLIKGYNNNYYLERSNKEQKRYLEIIFKNKVTTIYTELLFHPDLKVFTGSKHNLTGKIDSLLSGNSKIKKIFARQETFLIKK